MRLRPFAALTALLVFAITASSCLFHPQRALLKPPAATQAAPAIYQVVFTTTKGPFTIEVHREWSPNGADRFYYLARHGFYNGAAFFRVVPKFVVQWGLSADPRISAAWADRTIKDDPVVKSNTRGMVTFAMSGANTRTTQVYINFRDNSRLDKLGFSPFGEVVAGMDVVDALNGEYGEGAPRGKGPSQGRITREGAAYLAKEFPRLDRILSTKVRNP
ncbi:MAG TPA: peptidylprolyl isomerase [Terriglobales bacterium]|nr:peptidylprolyl isomerase [Terriglobales bacterium]